jgi:flagellar hook-length control protein FliK
MMSVRTSGRTVSLEIKAQDPEAKKIIEESIESLRDSLSQKSLDLAKVDIVAQPQRSGESEFGSQMDLGSQQRGFRQESAGQEQGRDRQEFPFEAPLASGNLKSRGIGPRPGRSSGSGTLDLIA